MRSWQVFSPLYIAGLCSGAAEGLPKRADCDAADLVYSILQTPLQDIATSLCSSYLGYPRSTSTTVTAPGPAVTLTNTLPPSTVTRFTLQVDTIGGSATVTITDRPFPVVVTQTVTVATQTTYAKRGDVKKRTLPILLLPFAASRISSACSCIIPPTTATNTITVPNPATTTTTTRINVPATSTVTVTSTITVTSTVTGVVTTRITVPPETLTSTITVTTTVVRPKICNAQGLPGANGSAYFTNFNASQDECIAVCKIDPRCLSSGFYLTTNPETGEQLGTCRRYERPVTDVANLGDGFYTFNDKAC